MELSTSTIENQNGTIVFAGTETAISILFNYIKAAKTTEDFLEDYPTVKLDQVLDVLAMAEDEIKLKF